jgi:hypothetical protein
MCGNNAIDINRVSPLHKGYENLYLQQMQHLS